MLASTSGAVLAGSLTISRDGHLIIRSNALTARATAGVEAEIANAACRNALELECIFEQLVAAIGQKNVAEVLVISMCRGELSGFGHGCRYHSRDDKQG